MSALALLVIIASGLSGHHVRVTCGIPPVGYTWVLNDGYSSWPPDRIYLQKCRAVIRLEPEPLLAYGHEIIHIEHHNWTERQVHRYDHWYTRVVVRPRIVAAKLKSLVSPI